jgi:hypothetical protein
MSIAGVIQTPLETSPATSRSFPCGIALLRARDVSDAYIKTLLAAVRKLVWGYARSAGSRCSPTIWFLQR